MIHTESWGMFEKISEAPFTATGIRPGGLDLTQQALARSKLRPGSRILDVGCGTGITVEYLLYEQMMQVQGIDSSARLVAQGKLRNATLPLLRGDAATIPFSDASFDCVLLECVLSLVRDRKQVLTECNRVLKLLGTLIVTDLYARNPDAIGPLRRLSLQSCLKGSLDKNEFLHECSVIGFEHGCFDDHSQKLQDFAAQVVWTYGSLDRFWTETGETLTDPGWIRRAIREARPGYFLYVGSKIGGDTGINDKWGEK